MAVDRAPLLDRRFLDGLAGLASGSPCDLDAPLRAGSRLTGRAAIELFDAQVASRHLDFAARALRARGEGFYTIGSSGHEGNAAVAAALRPTDPAFLHYRSGAFFVARAHQVAGQTPLLDILLGLCASVDDPIAGGRHKVFGSHALAIPPQTSTIASHLPKAVGAAVALDRASRLGVGSGSASGSVGTTPADAIIVCTFGDASANHSTATGAINTAAWTAFQHVPVPILFVCEDNGIGISVRTPAGWIAGNYGHRPGIHYVWGDGLDLPHAYDAAPGVPPPAHGALARSRGLRRRADLPAAGGDRGRRGGGSGARDRTAARHLRGAHRTAGQLAVRGGPRPGRRARR